MKKSGPRYTSVSCDELKKKVTDNKFVLAYFGNETNGLFTDGFEGLASRNDDITFVKSEDTKCAAEYGQKVDVPSIIFFRDFDDKVKLYEYSRSSHEQIADWLNPLKLPAMF